MNHLLYKKNGLGAINLCFWALFAILAVYEAFLSDILGGVTKYILILWCMFMFLINAAGFFSKPSFWRLSIFFWWVYYLLSLAWTDGYEQASTYVMTVSLSVLLFLLASSFLYSEEYLKSILKMFKVSSVSLAIVSFFCHTTIANGTRHVVSLFGTSIDPNNQVALVGIGGGLCLLGFFTTKGLHRIYNLISYTICLISIFRCGSRSGVVLLLAQIMIVVLFLSPQKNSFSKRLSKYFLVSVVGCITIVVLLNFVAPDTLDRLLGMGDLNFTDGTNREDIWLDGWNMFLQAPFFGNGWGSFECHNTFLTILVDVGLVGSSFLLALLICLSIHAIKKSECSSLMIFASGMIPSFFIGAQNKRFFWIAIILPTLILFCREKKNAC